jgi:hypothetical protein
MLHHSDKHSQQLVVSLCKIGNASGEPLAIISNQWHAGLHLASCYLSAVVDLFQKFVTSLSNLSIFR